MFISKQLIWYCTSMNWFINNQIHNSWYLMHINETTIVLLSSLKVFRIAAWRCLGQRGKREFWLFFQRVEFFSLFNFILKIGKKSPYIKISFYFFLISRRYFKWDRRQFQTKHLLWPYSNKCTFVNTFKTLNKHNSFWSFYFRLGFHNKRYSSWFIFDLECTSFIL